MKVALVCPYPVSQFAARCGVAPLETNTYPSSNVNLVSGLAKLANVELHVVSLARGLKRNCEVMEPGVAFHLLRDPKFSGLASGFQWQKQIIHRCLAQIEPDVVHGIGTETSCAYSAVTAESPSVVTMRGIISELLKQSKRQELQTTWKVRGWFERYTLRRASHVICISPYVKDVLQEISSNPIYYSIDNAVNPSFFSVHPRRDAEVRNLLFVGRIDPMKGVLDAVKAMTSVTKAMPRAQLLVVGPVSDHQYYRHLRAFVQSNNLSDSVRFLGWRDHNELPRLLARADLLMFPSQLETFGNVIAESMAAGVPVVAVNAAAIPHLIEDGHDGFLVDPGDTEALAGKAIAILENERLRQTMGRNARETALRRWHPNVIAKQTLDVYKEILESE